MSKVTLSPYILTDANGGNPRIMIPVKTPAALVMIETRLRGIFTASSESGEGVPIAINVAKAYVRSHQARIERLYLQLERIRDSS
jgi:hypothetical protein